MLQTKVSTAVFPCHLEPAYRSSPCVGGGGSVDRDGSSGIVAVELRRLVMAVAVRRLATVAAVDWSTVAVASMQWI